MNKDYIVQCAAAEELQEGWKPKEGDWFEAEHTVWCIGDAVLPVIGLSDGHFECQKEPEPTIHVRDCGWGCEEKLTWLPTQEQLWAMLPNENAYTLGTYMGGFYGEIYWGDGRMPSVTSLISESLEETLLEMVMLVKYEEDWNSDKGAWV